MATMTKNGVSTCNANGTEKYEKFSTHSRKTPTAYRYDYRTSDGELFSIVRPTLAECRAERDKWLANR